MAERRVYELSLCLRSPFLFEGLSNSRLGIDSALIRDEAGRPIIPAAQVKGVLRDACRALTKTNAMTTAEIESLFGVVSKPFDGNEHDRPERGAAIFGDLTSEVAGGGTRTTRIRIDEATGTVARGALQVIELAAPFGSLVTFSGRLIVRYSGLLDPARTETALRKAIGLIPAIGANKSAGFGEIVSAKRALEEIVSERRDLAAAEVSEVPSEPVAFSVTFDRPILVDTRNTAGNVFEGSEIVPGAAFKGALAELLWHGGHDPENHPVLSKALAALRISHGFPASQDGGPDDRDNLPVPKSAVFGRDGKFGDALHGGYGKAAMFGPTDPGLFVEQGKDAIRKVFRDQVGLPRSSRPRLSRTHVAIGKGFVAGEGQLYSTQSVSVRDGKWIATVDPGRIQDRATAGMLMVAIRRGLDGIGRTGATATFTPRESPPSSPSDTGGDVFDITLLTPAIMFGPGDAPVAERYASYWREAFDGRLINHFATRRLAGGYIAYRRRVFGPDTYYPFILTEEGSVFRVEIRSEDGRARMADALRYGLPVPDIDGVRLDWRNCPYLPENGYGEIRRDMIDHARLAANVTFVEAAHV